MPGTLAALIAAAFTTQLEAPRLTYEDARHYLCYRRPGPIVIDGKLDDAGWREIPRTEPFVDIEGDVKPRPRFETRAKMAWDNEFFYVATWMEEPHVWGTLTEHDSVIFRDNDFEVFIDPDADNHQYYEFEINALNTGWDLRLVKPYRDGGPALNEWEIPGLRTAVHVSGTLNDPSDEDDGWSVEIAFPWEALAEFSEVPSPPKAGDQWRVNFSRVEWRHRLVDGRYEKRPDTREDNWVWSPQGVIDMHRPERWGYVQFAEGPVGSARFRPDPTAPARDYLHRVYYAQRAYRAARDRWAVSLEALEIAEPPEGVRDVTLDVSEAGYQVSVMVPGAEGEPAWKVTLREDSKITARPTADVGS